MQERGGRLFVWTRSVRCCSGRTTWLEASTSPPGGRDFQLVDSSDMEVYLPTDIRQPSELHVELKGRRRRLQAYWDGCAWVV